MDETFWDPVLFISFHSFYLLAISHKKIPPSYGKDFAINEENLD